MKKHIAILVFCFIAKSVTAQMVKPPTGFILSEKYDSSVTLAKADYIVQGEVVISKTAVLTIEPGVRIFFIPGPTLNVKGVLNVKGEEKN